MGHTLINWRDAIAQQEVRTGQLLRVKRPRGLMETEWKVVIKGCTERSECEKINSAV